MDQKKITSNIEVTTSTWENLKSNIDSIDPIRRDSDKHYVQQALILADYLLETQYENINKDIQNAKREIQKLEEVLDQ